ncbi:MAG: MBOAT family protein [bacterium]|nr:MBOAT family protein [bacterium]
MIFNTWVFAAFALASLTIYWTSPARLRPLVLVLSGIVFYAYSYPPYLILIGGLAVVTYATAKGIVNARAAARGAAARWWLTAGVVASVGVLFVFKYTHLFAASLASITHGHVALSVPKLLVPLAISFFTFEFVHFLVDVYKGKIEDFGVREFATFAMFYPTLVAGPIKRYQNFEPQIGHTRTLSQLFIAANVYRVLLGLAKKSIIADSMTPLTQPLLTPGAPYHTGDYWIAMLAYTAKIYFDFTGYSDIAIGMAGLLGYQILENFDRPYWSPNISQFWRRWHISLSSWIRDYIFIPLGGSRGNKFVTMLNLTFVMAIAGLWHGASWHFVVWGLWHGLGLAVHRVWSLTGAKLRVIANAPAPLLATASIVTTFAFVAVGWILFASPSLTAAYEAARGLL